MHSSGENSKFHPGFLWFRHFPGETHNKAKYDKIRPKTVSETLDLAGGPKKSGPADWDEGTSYPCLNETCTRKHLYERVPKFSLTND